MSRIPIIAAFRPKISRSVAGKINPPDAVDLFDAVFGRRRQTQRHTVFERQRCAVHFIRGLVTAREQNHTNLYKDFP